jgi:serine phosphatase RsbU (regulator of sigma subunit)
MKRKLFAFIILTISTITGSVAQNDAQIASLKNQLKAKNSQQKLAELNYKLALEYASKDRDTSIMYADRAIGLSQKHNLGYWLALALTRKGEAVSHSGNDSLAITLFHRVLKTKFGAENDTIYAYANWQMGSSFYHFANYDSALIYFFKALEIYTRYETPVYQKIRAQVLNNIGNVHYFVDRKRAVNYYLESLKVYDLLNDTAGRAAQSGNLGLIYVKEKDTLRAIEFSERSLHLYESYVGNDISENKRKRNIATSLINLAYAHMQFGNYEKALNYAHKSLELRIEIDYPKGIAISTDMIGAIYFNMKRYEQAIPFFEKAVGMLHEQGLREYESTTLRSLAECYGHVGRYKEAVELYPKAIDLLDTIYKLESTEQIAKVEGLYQTQKDNKVALMEREAEINELQLKKRENYLLTAVIVTFLLGIMSLILYFFYRVRTNANVALEKKNNEITVQKQVIEEVNLHITDSIRYAERLQAAILPKAEMFEKHFSKHTILYKPKDIVSGDFYWMENLPPTPSASGGGRTISYLAVADCTGHGVPGAMVSMVGFQGLNKAVLEEKLTSPAAILQRLSDYVEEAFEKSGGSVKDGMDICLVAIDTNKRTVTYSGAHNALWILTSKEELPNANLREEENGHRMFELKADRRSIGGFMDAGSFTETTLELNQGDCLFLFSDGFADQFGGPEGKKIGSKRMRETLREMALQTILPPLVPYSKIGKAKKNRWMM